MKTLISLDTNPFPAAPVVTTSIDALPNYRHTSVYGAAVEKLEDYREDFASPGSRQGLALGIRGRFGSGKTHLVFQLIDYVTAQRAPAFKAIYCKADHADVLDLYVNHFARKLEADDLKNMVAFHLAKLLHLKGDAGPLESGERSLVQIAQEQVDKLIAENPQSILTLVEQDLLPVVGLHRELDDAIGKTAHGLAEDFVRAYSRITDPSVGPLAIRWIQGGQLSASEQKDLALDRPAIREPGDAREAFRFLLTAFKQADFAILFCLDEFERFSSRGTSSDQKAAAGVLKDLAESFRDSGQFLIVSGVNDAWNVMPDDVFDRIKRADIVEVRLTKEEAAGLLNEYCAASRTSVKEIFDPEAVDLLYESSAHNARRLLTLAHDACELAVKTRGISVSARNVEDAAKHLLSGADRLQLVAQAIEAAAAEHALFLRKDIDLSGWKCDFVLGNPEQPELVIALKRSLFKLSEIEATRSLAAMSEMLRQQHSSARFGVVIVGYSTAAVRAELAKVVDHVFQYDEEKFSEEFRTFLKHMASGPELQRRVESQTQAYESLLKKIDDIERGRRVDIEQLRESLESREHQAQRSREGLRDQRVTDKAGETLNELSSLIAQEEKLGISVLSREGKDEAFIAPESKLEEVLRLIDKQRAYVRRAEMLSETLPERQEVSALLGRLTELTDLSERMWFQAYEKTGEVPALFLDSAHGLSEVRQLFRQRTAVLNELDTLHLRHLSRESEGVMARASNQLMRISWPVFALCLLWVAGLAVNYQSIRSGWDREQETLSYYAKTLTELQRLARRLKIVGVLKDKDPEFDRYLIGQLVDLEERSFAVMSLPYQPLRYAFAAASTLRDDLRRLRDTLQAAYEPDIDREANRISAASFELLTNIASVSPGDFVLRVYSRSIFLAAAAFGPVTALIGWSFLSPLMKRRAARLRVRDATPKH